MVVCTIELWPHGNKAKRERIGVVAIANDGTGTTDIGNYRVALGHAGIYKDRKGAWKTGKVKGHRRVLSPYHLLARAIQSALEGRTIDRRDEALLFIVDAKDDLFTPKETANADRKNAG